MVRMASSRRLTVLAGVTWMTAAWACNTSSGSDDAPLSISAEDGGQSSGSIEEDAGTVEDDGATVDGAAPPTASMVAMGASFACVLARDGTVHCWGNNDAGQLGKDPLSTPTCGASRCSPQPVKVEGLGPAVKIAAGDDFACALTRDGFVSCWGSNAKGQLATPLVASSFVPRQAIARATDLTAAGRHACVITTDQLVHCWGENTCEIFGNKDAVQDVPRRVPGVPQVRQISVASDAMCVTLLDETALCWGADRKGSLGHDLSVVGPQCNGGNFDSKPLHVQGTGSDLPLSPIDDIHMGEGVACARKKGGQVLCWGDNTRGAIGQGFAEPSTHARAVEVPALIAKKLDVRGQTACVITADRVLCWGDGRFGQLDTLGPVPACGNQVCRALPYVIPSMSPVRELSVGPGSIATIKTDLSLWTWGRNGSGELGIGPTDGANQACPGAPCRVAPRSVSGVPVLQ